MKTTQHIAKHFREVHFGKNWTWSFLKEHLEDVTWQEATTQISSFNTIAALTFHIHYFIAAAIRVLEGKELNAHDKFSFDVPEIASNEDWQNILKTVWQDGERFATLIEQLPEGKLWKTFVEEKYGNYYRNLQGTVEHTHYHLGQIVILKKLMREKELL